MTKSYTTIKKCRVCKCGKLKSILSLGDLCVSTFVNNPREKVVKAPLELVLCERCTLLQLRDTAPQELMYSRHYWYRSGLNTVIINDLKEITEVASSMANLEANDIVLDIGANDGTMLDFYPKNLIRVGCEPADNLAKELKKVTQHVIHDFWNYDNWKKLFGEKKAKVITAVGMFYDMEDPNQFISDSVKALEKDGIFIAQLMCLRPMLEKNDLGNICHEHLEYYSYESLKYLFETNGLEIFKVEENSINGGSYRIFAKHFRKGSVGFPEKFTLKDYKDFEKRIISNRDKCVKFIKEVVSSGKKVYVYGASTKGNTILQYYGLDSTLISGAAEKSSEKWGKYTVGSLIPIVSEEEARKKADYFLVLPWAFFKSFHSKEKGWLEKGGKFIVPLPEFRIVGKNDNP